MSPDQKAQLVVGLQNLGYAKVRIYVIFVQYHPTHRYGVSMCGDGANDCGVSAHVPDSMF